MDSVLFGTAVAAGGVFLLARMVRTLVSATASRMERVPTLVLLGGCAAIMLCGGIGIVARQANLDGLLRVCQIGFVADLVTLLGSIALLLVGGILLIALTVWRWQRDKSYRQLRRRVARRA